MKRSNFVLGLGGGEIMSAFLAARNRTEFIMMMAAGLIIVAIGVKE